MNSAPASSEEKAGALQKQARNLSCQTFIRLEALHSTDQGVHVTTMPSVKFEVGPAGEESRCQHWKLAVPPATAA